MLKNLVAKFLNFVKNKEPVVVVSSVSAAVAAFVTEAQGNLTGQNAWLAVAWAAVTWITRQTVTSPATAAVIVASAAEGEEAKKALEWLRETAAQWNPDYEVEAHRVADEEE